MREMEPGINYQLVICTFISDQNTATLFCLLKMLKQQDIPGHLILKLGNKLWHCSIYYFRRCQWVYIKMVKVLFYVIYFAYKWKHTSIQMNLEKSTRLKYEGYDVCLEQNESGGKHSLLRRSGNFWLVLKLYWNKHKKAFMQYTSSLP